MKALCEVASFSLESKSTTPSGELSARPKLVPGEAIHCCTTDVMSMVKNWPAVATGSVVPVEVLAGWLA